MIDKAASRRALLASALSVAAACMAAAPARAASDATEIYIANVRIHADVLAASDKLAATRAGESLRRFVDGQAGHQGDVVAALDRWRAQEGATPAQVASLPTEVQTGRSVAIDAPIDENAASPPPGIGVLMAGASATLDQLSSLDGAAFDGSYKATQRSALKTLEGLYESYAHTGDNAALRDMATKELDAVRAEMAALDKT